MKIANILHSIEEVAPLSFQESWDNSGLQIGDKEIEATGVLLCTDITEAVIDEAIEKGCNLIVSHHPLLFHGLKTIQGNTEIERCVISAIQHGICIYSAHTSMDNYLHGVSGWMAEKLGIHKYEWLSKSSEETGLGVIGELENAVDFATFLQLVKDTFQAKMIRYTDPKKRIIKRVALCGGAGSEFMDKAKEMDADIFISADFRYHDFMRAHDVIGVMDIGHFESEQYTKEIFYQLIKRANRNLLIEYAQSDRSAYKIG